jgi:hypothetical protein
LSVLLGATLSNRPCQVIERTVTDNNGEHPFHLHVVPYQLQSMNGNDGEWTKEGDWHDTLLLLEPNIGNNYVMRFQTVTFGGHYALHCHVLAHEDLGMMAMWWTDGEEGTPASVPSAQRECLLVSGGPCAGASARNVTATNAAIEAALGARCRADPTVRRWQRNATIATGAPVVRNASSL